MQNPIEELKGRHTGQIAWLVGKGPSLLNVTADMIGTGPIITINHAVRKIATLGLPNTVYSMQKDGGWPHVGNTGGCPRSCTEIVNDQCPYGQTELSHGETLLIHDWHSFCCWPDYEPRYMFKSTAWGLWRETPSNVIALKIIQLFGCKTVVMVAFDGMFCGDTQVANDGLSSINKGTPDYATRQSANINSTLLEFDNVFWLSPGCEPAQAWQAFYKSESAPAAPSVREKEWRTQKAYHDIVFGKE